MISDLPYLINKSRSALKKVKDHNLFTIINIIHTHTL